AQAGRTGYAQSAGTARVDRCDSRSRLGLSRDGGTGAAISDGSRRTPRWSVAADCVRRGQWGHGIRSASARIDPRLVHVLAVADPSPTCRPIPRVVPAGSVFAAVVPREATGAGGAADRPVRAGRRVATIRDRDVAARRRTRPADAVLT